MIPYAWRHVFKWAFVLKTWHPDRKRLARLRALYWWVVRRYELEICARCGGPVKLVFHVPDAVWAEVTGYGERRPDGESAPGCLCPPCVDDLVIAAGLPFPRWTFTLDDTAMRG